MNLSVVPAYDAGRAAPPAQPGIHADLTELMKLEFKARGFSFLPRQPIHSLLAGRHASRLRGRGLNFEEIRRYLPGDDIRTMDWRVTARTMRPHVRVYTEERDRPVLLVVDQRRTMFFGSRRVMKSVAAAEMAALAAWRVLHAGDRVGAIVFDDEQIVEIRPHRSRRRVLSILGAVVAANRRCAARDAGPPNAAAFNEALRRAARLATHDFLVCTISDGFGFDEETRRIGTRIAEHNDVLVGFVYDPLEAELPAAGRLVFGASGNQLEVDASDRSLRGRYAAEFEERQTALDHFCRQRRAPRLRISTERDVAAQIQARLGHVSRGP